MEFDADKIELIYFLNKRWLVSISLRISDRNEIELAEIVKWLGVYLDRKLNFKRHVIKRMIKVEKVFLSIKGLINTGRGFFLGDKIAVYRVY